MEIILSDLDLINHFKFLLYFSKNIIGYGLKPYHKGKIVEFLKDQNKNSTILAVGDGFNDMAMLKKADIGVQLYHRDVPVVFGDVLISNLSLLKKVIFCDSKIYIESILTAIVLKFLTQTSLNILYTIFNTRALYFGQLFNSLEICTFFTVVDIGLVIFTIFNRKIETKI